MRPRIAGLRQHQSEVIGEAAWPAIVAREDWEALTAMLNDPSRRSKPPSREYRSPDAHLRRVRIQPRFMAWRQRRSLLRCRKDSGGCGSYSSKRSSSNGMSPGC